MEHLLVLLYKEVHNIKFQQMGPRLEPDHVSAFTISSGSGGHLNRSAVHLNPLQSQILSMIKSENLNQSRESDSVIAVETNRDGQGTVIIGPSGCGKSFVAEAYFQGLGYKVLNKNVFIDQINKPVSTPVFNQQCFVVLTPDDPLDTIFEGLRALDAQSKLNNLGILIDEGNTITNKIWGNIFDRLSDQIKLIVTMNPSDLNGSYSERCFFDPSRFKSQIKIHEISLDQSMKRWLMDEKNCTKEIIAMFETMNNILKGTPFELPLEVLISNGADFYNLVGIQIYVIRQLMNDNQKLMQQLAQIKSSESLSSMERLQGQSGMNGESKQNRNSSVAL